MSLYADTSALIKRYIHENGSEQVVALLEEFPIIGTAVLTQVEMASAMAKAVRLGWVDETERIHVYIHHFYSEMKMGAARSSG